MKLEFGTLVLITGLCIGLGIGIIYTKIRYGLPLVQFFH